MAEAVALAYSTALDAYDFGPGHPMRPHRVSLTVDLISAYGVIGSGAFEPIEFAESSRDDLARAHDMDYIDTVVAVSARPDRWLPTRGLGPGDTPGFSGMHRVSALISGATSRALEVVLEGTFRRAFAPAGGLHHAHRERAAGFCVYNDVAVAIHGAFARHPDLRVCYLDIDAHHGDGVQESFYADPRVLTISVHEDGRYLYPGTGSARERGEGPGAGAALNVPLPPYATPECYLLAFDEVVAPAVRAFAPDVIVTQNGADAHWQDPLTSLGQTIGGYETLFSRITQLADEVCGRRLVACGGGGYAWATVVPRVWTLLAASLADIELPDPLPAAWQERVSALGFQAPSLLREDHGPPLDDETRREALRLTRRVTEQLSTS